MKKKNNNRMIIARVTRRGKKNLRLKYFPVFSRFNSACTSKPDVRTIGGLLNPLLQQTSEISKSEDKISHSLLIHLASSGASRSVKEREAK